MTKNKAWNYKTSLKKKKKLCNPDTTLKSINHKRKDSIHQNEKFPLFKKFCHKDAKTSHSHRKITEEHAFMEDLH